MCLTFKKRKILRNVVTRYVLRLKIGGEILVWDYYNVILQISRPYFHILLCDHSKADVSDDVSAARNFQVKTWLRRRLSHCEYNVIEYQNIQQGLKLENESPMGFRYESVMASHKNEV